MIRPDVVNPSCSHVHLLYLPAIGVHLQAKHISLVFTLNQCGGIARELINLTVHHVNPSDRWLGRRT